MNKLTGKSINNHYTRYHGLLKIVTG